MNKHILLLWLLFSASTQAGVVTDGSVGAQVTLSGADYAITQDLGALQGTNLFHSFEQFSLEVGESATFSGDTGIQNIFSRVTGGNVSTIDGLIRSTIPDADLYLMNPAGMVFNEKARLDVQGSFYITTADAIHFSDDTAFNANPQENTVLSTAAPSAFGFLDDEIGKLSIFSGELSVPVMQTLGIAAGDINTNNTTLITRSGNIYITSVASAGKVYLQPELEPTATLGNLNMNSSVVNINPPPTFDLFEKGSIFIRAGLFELTNSSINSSSRRTSEGGDINIYTQDFVSRNSSVVSLNQSSARGGNITIQADNQILLASSSRITPGLINRTQINTSNVNLNLPSGENIQAGDSGNITLSAQDIKLLDGTLISSKAFGSGQGGEIVLSATNNIEMSGQTNLNNPTNINSDSGQERFSTLTDVGDGGSISISAKNLTMNDGANIVANTYGVGQGGKINVNVTEKLVLETESTAGIGNFISSSTTLKSTEAGDSGSIVIQAGELLFANGSFLTTNTSGAGNAGNISVNVAQNATITGTSAQTDSGILSAAGSSSTGGNAGDISLTIGNQLFLSDSAIIDASTFNTGLGGNVTITAGDLTMRNQAYIGAASASSGNTGDIKISITDDNLEMYDTSYITTEATFADGGNIYVSMPNYVYISSNSEITTSIKSGVGGGGNIDLDAEFTVLDGGKILAQAFGGPGGNIDIITTSIYNLTDEPIEQVISASSQLGVDGVVTVRSPEGDTDEGVLILSGNFLQVDKLLRSLCEKKRSQGNSFVVTGRESYPNLINDWLPSNATQLVLQRCEL
ncbi:filamentous hemagglutinin N-terminal domain-containing protein [Candidatus Albibeggiatoa sp. nov. NOAA]|uniref:two-partner secretion domain-containing protein n=1 Tax=Candidatus Albibeggiatoa sp. nov. NOAA TaxID=3162724 RepID=UPI003305040D|nr:filamentous hemagglutinin N-terminal domain-containing protein [Thiotrichaceae bacterium]